MRLEVSSRKEFSVVRELRGRSALVGRLPVHRHASQWMMPQNVSETQQHAEFEHSVGGRRACTNHPRRAPQCQHRLRMGRMAATLGRHPASVRRLGEDHPACLDAQATYWPAYEPYVIELVWSELMIEKKAQ